MFYNIRHLTRFRYDSAVTESIMELRMQPRTEGPQRCLSFQVLIDPRTRVNVYRDYLGNSVHHFDVPGKHTQLRIVAEAFIEAQMPPALPERLDERAWAELDALVHAGDYWEMLMPSAFAQPCQLLEGLTRELEVSRRSDPLTFVNELNAAIFEWFEYVPKSTRVDSPIAEAIEARKGVCQDFAHIMIALLRHVKIPCRYVSGYLSRSSARKDRSSEGATHAWVEALLPGGLGWVGFDPTNNLVAGDRHIRTAIGRDYADVPPAKGVFKGSAASELTVSVRVLPSDAPALPENDLAVPEEWVTPGTEVNEHEEVERQQQQQQQQ